MSDNIIEKVAESPAIVLDETLDKTHHISKQLLPAKHVKKAKDYWRNLGPGLTTGAADDDPSGIATYSQTGAQYGFQLLWLSIFTLPLMSFVQEMCARIGLVTGEGLAGNIRRHYPKWVLYFCTVLLFAANSLNIGADLGAMAKATQLLFPQASFAFLLIAFAAGMVLFQIYTTYEKYARFLKFMALVLFSYVLSALIVKPDIRQILQHTFIPTLTFSKDQIFLVCGILGTTISPYLFFWQTSQEVEEQILEGKTTLKQRQLETTKKEIGDMRVDVWSGMFVSNAVMFFIIAACAATLNAKGITQIATAADAAEALRPIAGDFAYLLFTAGIIGTGLLAVPILAGSSSYAIAESFGWKHGLYRNLRSAYAFYGAIIFSMIIGLFLNFSGIDPIKALIYSAVANGLIAPVILILIVQISSNKDVMGKWVNKLPLTIAGWVVVLIMVVSGIAAIAGLVM